MHFFLFCCAMYSMYSNCSTSKCILTLSSTEVILNYNKICLNYVFKLINSDQTTRHLKRIIFMYICPEKKYIYPNSLKHYHRNAR